MFSDHNVINLYTWKIQKKKKNFQFIYYCCSVSKLCLTLCNPMDCSTPGFTVLHHLQPHGLQHARLQCPSPSPWACSNLSIESVMLSNHLIFCHLLLLLPSILPSIRVFSNESSLCIRWPKYWSLSFSISPSNSGLISFRIDWFDFLAVQGTLKSFLAPQFEDINSLVISLFYCPAFTSVHD